MHFARPYGVVHRQQQILPPLRGAVAGAVVGSTCVSGRGPPSCAGTGGRAQVSGPWWRHGELGGVVPYFRGAPLLHRRPDRRRLTGDDGIRTWSSSPAGKSRAGTTNGVPTAFPHFTQHTAPRSTMMRSPNDTHTRATGAASLTKNDHVSTAWLHGIRAAELSSSSSWLPSSAAWLRPAAADAVWRAAWLSADGPSGRRPACCCCARTSRRPAACRNAPAPADDDGRQVRSLLWVNQLASRDDQTGLEHT